jgi:hypothetical protein
MKRGLVLYIALNLFAGALPDCYLISAASLGKIIFHYREHHEESGLLDFLAQHYLDHSHTTQGPHDHQNLPFHHHHEGQQCFASSALFFHPQSPFQAAHTVYIESTQARLYDQPSHSASYLNEIWQPPRA